MLSVSRIKREDRLGEGMGKYRGQPSKRPLCNSMRFLMLNALTDRSGSGVRFWSIAKEVARLGHPVLFLERTVGRTGRQAGENIAYRAIRDSGVLWLDILRALITNFINAFLFRPHFVFALKPMPNTCIPALLLKLFFKCKIILDIDDLDFAYYPPGLRRNLIRLFFHFFPRNFDLITTHNQQLRAYIVNQLGIPSRKIYFLAQGIEAEQFIRGRADRHFQRKWGINPEDKVLIYCASLGITTDFAHILAVLLHFLQTSEDSAILVIGDGARKRDFVRDVKAHGLHKRIIFTGHIPHTDMPGVLKLADVGINYMAPTKANQCRATIKVREYLAAGLKVVCNPVGDTETFKSYVTLCSRIQEFPEAIREALDMKNQDKTREAQEFVASNYSWPPLVKDFLSYLLDAHR